MSSSDARDHIFISYATEEMALADWLARKLASQGYAVWYDRLHLLGGEPWPQDIDVAIKERTFRMLGLMSRASIKKPNPVREWTLAQALARERNVPDFFIPLNVDGMRPTELPWTVSDTNYIAFHNGWARGFSNVLKKLSAINAPRILSDGASRAASTLEDYGSVIQNQPESLISNVLAVTAVPEGISKVETKIAVAPHEARGLRRRWPCHRVSDNEFLTFEFPPKDVAEQLGCSPSGAAWRGLPAISGINSRNVTVSLIHASVDFLMASRGLAYCEENRRWYVPAGLTKNDWLRFRRADGTESHVLGVGERTFRKQPYRYHLSPSLSVLRGSEEPFRLILRIGVHLTDLEGRELPGAKVPSRRKHLCRSWWNWEWLGRTLALVQLLAGGSDTIRIGASTSTQLAIDASPLTFEAPRSLNEEQSEPVDPQDLATEDEEDDDE